MIEKICVFCKSDFKTDNAAKIYCGSGCRSGMFNLIKKARNAAKREKFEDVTGKLRELLDELEKLERGGRENYYNEI